MRTLNANGDWVLDATVDQVVGWMLSRMRDYHPTLVKRERVWQVVEYVLDGGLMPTVEDDWADLAETVIVQLWGTAIPFPLERAWRAESLRQRLLTREVPSL